MKLQQIVSRPFFHAFPKEATPLFFCLLFVLLFWFLDHGTVSGDGMAMYVTAESLLQDGDFDLANQYEKYQALREGLLSYAIVHNPETDTYTSLWPFGITLFWTPFLIIFWTLDAMGFFPEYYTMYEVVLPGVFRAIGLAFALAANVYVILTWLLSVRITSRIIGYQTAQVITFLFVIGTPLLFYATIEPSYSHVVNALVVTWLVWAWLSYEDDSWQHGLTIGLIAGIGILVRWHLFPYIMLFGLATLRNGQWRRLAGIAVGTACVIWLINYSWLVAGGSFFRPVIVSSVPSYLAYPKPYEIWPR